jgi:predicted transcriptional regulator
MQKDANELRGLLNAMRGLSIGLLGQRRFGTHAPDVLLLVGVAIGHLEAKPMGASKLAAYCGIPRPTVIRKLRAMVRAELVERDGRGRYELTTKAQKRLEALK